MTHDVSHVFKYFGHSKFQASSDLLNPDNPIKAISKEVLRSHLIFYEVA